MEEQKKRCRPTVAQVRALQQEITALTDKNSVVIAQNKRLLAEVEKCRKDVEAMIESRRALVLERDTYCKEVVRLRSRGLFARILNK